MSAVADIAMLLRCAIFVFIFDSFFYLFFFTFPSTVLFPLDCRREGNTAWGTGGATTELTPILSGAMGSGGNGVGMGGIKSYNGSSGAREINI